MGIKNIISNLLKSADKNSKTGKNNNPDMPIDIPHSEDINYLKTEKIKGADNVKRVHSAESGAQKKSPELIKSDKMNDLSDARILEVLSNVYDPEIPIDIVNLGLVYDIDIDGEIVNVKMTMTAPGCPASAQITAEAKYLIEELEGVREANIEIVWDPPWDPSRMSEDAKQSMGYI